jgi:hypothetical protein
MKPRIVCRVPKRCHLSCCAPDCYPSPPPSCRSPKFIWAPCHVMYIHSCTHWLRPRNPSHPPALGSVYKGPIGQQRKTTSLCNPPVLHVRIINDDLRLGLLRFISPFLYVSNRNQISTLHQSDLNAILFTISVSKYITSIKTDSVGGNMH